MQTVQIEDYRFQYDEDDMVCFADAKNKRIAFIRGSDIQLVIDIVDDKLTFHPDVNVNILEVEDYLYRIESFF